MQTLIKRILAPVQLDTVSLWLVSQAAELASAHNASLHLLHVADPYECPGYLFNWFSFKGAQAFHKLSMEKKQLIDTWKHSLEKDFNIVVSSSVVWGDLSTCILREARNTHTDLIAVSEHGSGKQHTHQKKEIAKVIEKSPCQVITLLSGSRDITDWKQVVMPVNGYVPEARIFALEKIIGRIPLKVHLLTSAQMDAGALENEFYYITETIKRLKPAGNIQVQCESLGHHGNPVKSFLQYARNVGADLLMTNRYADQLAKPLTAEPFYFSGYT